MKRLIYKLRMEIIFLYIRKSTKVLTKIRIAAERGDSKKVARLWRKYYRYKRHYTYH